MDNLDDEIRLQVRTKSDRPVMNTSDTPEYMTLATHFKDGKESLGYESIQFTEGGADHLEPFEDEALLRGEVKPVVVRKNNVPPVTTNQMTKASPNGATVTIPTNSASVATADGRTVLPYQDIQGVFASIDTLNPKIEKQERYTTVPASIALFYNPWILILISMLLVFLIILEFVGCIYVF